MLELFPVVKARLLFKYSRLILHTALLSTDKDNDSVSMALDGKLTCQVLSFPITDFSNPLFEKVPALLGPFPWLIKGIPKIH